MRYQYIYTTLPRNIETMYAPQQNSMLRVLMFSYRVPMVQSSTHSEPPSCVRYYSFIRRVLLASIAIGRHPPVSADPPDSAGLLAT